MREQLKNTFSIITPSFNNGKYILESISSVFNQIGDFNIEHIVVDGKSTDNTVEILKNFEREHKREGYTFRWVSEKDSGMYDAILKGFEMSSGNIMAWINTDDKYQEGAFKEVNRIFTVYPERLWIKGITDYIEKAGKIRVGSKNRYIQKLIEKGIYGPIGKFIQQDSVFWRRELWDYVNHDEIKKYRLAGDFRLWQLFAQKSPLNSIDFHISMFRKRDGQLSGNMDSYTKEMSLTTNYSKIESLFYKLFFKLGKVFKLLVINK